MDFWEVIKKRRSIRKFDTVKAVNDEQIEKILEAGRLAPSAHNLQDWFFMIVKNPDLKKQLVDACLGQTFVAEASVILVICSNKKLADGQSNRHGPDFFTLQDTAIATQQMWLAITALGLASCWIGAFDEQSVRQVLKLGDYLRPVAILPVGYPAENPSSTSRKGLKEISRVI